MQLPSGPHEQPARRSRQTTGKHLLYRREEPFEFCDVRKLPVERLDTGVLDRVPGRRRIPQFLNSLVVSTVEFGTRGNRDCLTGSSRDDLPVQTRRLRLVGIWSSGLARRAASTGICILGRAQDTISCGGSSTGEGMSLSQPVSLRGCDVLSASFMRRPPCVPSSAARTMRITAERSRGTILTSVRVDRWRGAPSSTCGCRWR